MENKKYIEGTKIIDLTGEKFGKLTVIKFSGVNDNKRALWECECSCGSKPNKIYIGKYLRNGDTKSCGCLLQDTLFKSRITHGATRNRTNTRLYSIWTGMKNRCLYPSQKEYHNYGSRGIKVCEEWMNSFEEFQNWALHNGYKYNLTLERKNVNGNYEPSNCCWITQKEQLYNTRNTINITLCNITKPLKNWCDFFNINYSTVRNKYIRNNLLPEEGLKFYIDKYKINVQESLKQNKIVLWED